MAGQLIQHCAAPAPTVLAGGLLIVVLTVVALVELVLAARIVEDTKLVHADQRVLVRNGRQFGLVGRIEFGALVGGVELLGLVLLLMLRLVLLVLLQMKLVGLFALRAIEVRSRVLQSLAILLVSRLSICRMLLRQVELVGELLLFLGVQLG